MTELNVCEWSDVAQYFTEPDGDEHLQDELEMELEAVETYWENSLADSSGAWD